MIGYHFREQFGADVAAGALTAGVALDGFVVAANLIAAGRGIAVGFGVAHRFDKVGNGRLAIADQVVLRLAPARSSQAADGALDAVFERHARFSFFALLALLFGRRIFRA